jgi:hypothetical protein
MTRVMFQSKKQFIDRNLHYTTHNAVLPPLPPLSKTEDQS